MRTAFPIVAIVLAACNSGEAPDAAGAPTFHADVRPLLDQYCVRCHDAEGLGVGDWTDDQMVDAFAELIADRIETGEMPPAVSDPDCRDYDGADVMSVPDEAKDIVSRWIEAGRPMGDPADNPGVVIEDVDIEDPDLTLMMAAPYEPSFTDPDNPGNEYRCFIVDPGEEQIYLTAMDPIIGSGELVHHVVLNTLDRADIEERMRGDDGWSCIDEMEGDSMVAGWAPGAQPVTFPEGYTMTVGGDSVLVIQMHYYQARPEDAGKTDLSGYVFKTAPAAGRDVYMVPLGDFSFRIPAGDDAYVSNNRLSHNQLGIPVGLQVHAVFPHMHRLGTRYSMSIEHDDDTETCLVSGSYDFDNQLTYAFKERPMFGPGDTIDYSCEWNNSASNPDLVGDPIETSYGERTDEEMCFFFTLVSVGAP